MRPDEINKIVEYIKEQTDHKGDIFININNNNAIPIEWIRDYVGQWVSIPYKNFVLNMIKNWEKENEKDI